MKRQQTGILLSPDEESRLLAIAKRHRCYSRHGRTSGEPSWRVLMRDIADGRLTVGSPRSNAEVTPEHKQEKPFIFHENSPPKWWNLEMTIEAMTQKTKLTAEQLTAAGFGITGEFVIPPTGWRKWGAPPSWWVENPESSGMMLADAIRASGMPEEQLVAAGYTVHGPANWREVAL
jgi:hypothetical protein